MEYIGQKHPNTDVNALGVGGDKVTQIGDDRSKNLADITIPNPSKLQSSEVIFQEPALPQAEQITAAPIQEPAVQTEDVNIFDKPTASDLVAEVAVPSNPETNAAAIAGVMSPIENVQLNSSPLEDPALVAPTMPIVGDNTNNFIRIEAIIAERKAANDAFDEQLRQAIADVKGHDVNNIIELNQQTTQPESINLSIGA